MVFEIDIQSYYLRKLAFPYYPKRMFSLKLLKIVYALILSTLHKLLRSYYLNETLQGITKFYPKIISYIYKIHNLGYYLKNP